MATEKITVPDLGDAGEVEVIELLVSVGQTVAENDSLLVLESDKAAMEIPAPIGGVVKAIAINLGDQVRSGTEILTLETEGAEEEPENDDSAESDSAASDRPKTSEAKANTQEQSKDSKSESDDKSAADNGSVQTSEETVSVPDLGTDDEVEIIEMHVSEGDSIAADDPLLTLESDKAAMDVPAPSAGVVTALLVKVGDKVKTGAEILKLKTTRDSETSGSEEAESGTEFASRAQPENAQESGKAEIDTKQGAVPASDDLALATPEPKSGERVYAGPAVRKLARELGVELGQVSGTGARNRITKEDLHEFVKGRISGASSGTSVASQMPDIDFSKFGEVEKVERTKLDKLTAANMHRNWTSVPHVAQFHEADVTELEAFRAQLKPESERKGVKLTFLPFLLKACARSLQEYPQFNVSLHSSGEYLFQKKYIHIGVAVATEAGLVVPVLRDVDKKSIWELAAEIIELTDKAKARKLSREDMQGACFTISSLGAIGGTGFIPIVNAPEVAILGVAKTQTKPVYIDGELKPRSMLPLTLAYDHKAVNGVDGGLFATYLVKLLGDIRHILV